MAAASSQTMARYHQPMWGQMDKALKNCFIGASILGVAVLITILIAPLPAPVTMTIQDVPERIARLILKKPSAPVITAPERVTIQAPDVQTPPERIKDKPKPPPRTKRKDQPRVAEDKGVQGRQKAQTEVTQNLAQVTGSLDKALDNLSKSLSTSEAAADQPKKTRKRPRRGVRSGRSRHQIAAISGIIDLSSADVTSSGIESKGISIAAISDIAVADGGDETPPGSSSNSAASGRNEFRSNESLLNAVRRYTPGIQFCYDNELKKNPSLRGKLVVSMTVLANGSISEAVIVEDSLKSKAVRDCVMAQIRGWQLPEIPQGVTSFKTPFVFTPSG